MSKNIRNHYIPCLYLKGFSASPNKGRKSHIWVYDKKNHSHYSRKIEKVAKIKNYYPDSVESMLAKQIEAPAAPIFNKIRNGKLPDFKDKIKLSIFINVMITRVPYYREWLNEYIPNSYYMSQASIEEEIKAIYEWDKIKTATEINNFLKLAEKYRSEVWNNLYNQYKDPNIKNKFVILVSNMRWVFYYVQSEAKFLTSDNPVNMTKTYGLYHKDGKLFFPISSDLCLVASLGNDKEEFIHVQDKDYEDINNRTASNATRFIFYHKKNDWVKKITLNRLPEPG